MLKNRPIRYSVFILLTLSLVKVACITARGPVSIELDAIKYWELSDLTHAGDPLFYSDPIAYRTPVYPWFLAILKSMSGARGFVAIAVAQSLLYVASGFLAGCIARRITAVEWALPIGLFLHLLTVSAVTYCSTILTETLFAFVLILHLHAVVVYVQNLSYRTIVWAAISFVLVLLTRPIAIWLWPAHVVLAVWIFARQKGNQHTKDEANSGLQWRQIMLQFLSFAVLTLTLLSPWLIRNQQLFGEPFITEFVGRNIWVVTFQDQAGADLIVPETPAAEQLQRRLQLMQYQGQWWETWPVANTLVASGLSDPDADQLMQQVCYDAISAQPYAFAIKAIRRIGNFWRTAASELPEPMPVGNFYGMERWSNPNLIADQLIRFRFGNWVLGNTIIFIILLASLAFLFADNSCRPWAIWSALILVYFDVVTGVLEIPTYRYRLVIEPVMIFVIAVAFLRQINFASLRRQKT